MNVALSKDIGRSTFSNLHIAEITKQTFLIRYKLVTIRSTDAVDVMRFGKIADIRHVCCVLE